MKRETDIVQDAPLLKHRPERPIMRIGPEMTVREIAELTRVSQRTVTRWIDSGELPEIRYPGEGRKVIRRIARREFLAFRERAMKRAS
jgi:excisionase family DNA binding protein